jgi:hypothetical protein
MALGIFKPSFVRGLSSRSAEVVRFTVSRPGTERHQTALRGRAKAPAGASTAADEAATPQKPLRTDEPVMQNGVLDPLKVTADSRSAPRESRPAGAWCGLAAGRVGVS